jgi:tight adherence protein B
MTSTTLQIPIEPRPEFAAILREKRFAGPVVEKSDSAQRIDRAFDRLILESGTQFSGALVLRLCLLAALTAGGSVFVLSQNLLATALAIAAGAVVPVVVLAITRARRRARLADQLPALVQHLLRAVRGGRPLETSLEQIAERLGAPLGEELRLALRRRQLGLGLADALCELPERTGLPGMQILVAALRLNERHGGNLADSLQELAKSLEDGAREARHSREANAADWASGVLVFLLQAAVVWLFVVADPQQISRIGASRASLAMAAAAGATLIAGVYCLLRFSVARRRV